MTYLANFEKKITLAAMLEIPEIHISGHLEILEMNLNFRKFGITCQKCIQLTILLIFKKQFRNFQNLEEFQNLHRLSTEAAAAGSS